MCVVIAGVLPRASELTAAPGDLVRRVVEAERAGTCAEVGAERVQTVEALVAATRAATCWIETEHPETAVALVRAVDSASFPSAEAARARLSVLSELRARTLLASGAPDLASAAFEALESDFERQPTGVRARILYYHALSLEAAGDIEGARALYRRLLRTYPASPWATRAQVVLPAEVPEGEGAVAMAARALAARNYPAAEALLRLAACPHGDDCAPLEAVEAGGARYEAAYQLGFLLYRFRREFAARSLPWLETVARVPGARAVDALHDYARAVVRLDRHDEAYRALATFARVGRPDPRTDGAAYDAAWILLDADRYAEAAAAFEHYVAGRGSRASDATWWQGWALFRDGRCAEALDVWGRFDDARTDYWRGVCALETGAPDRAVGLFREASQRDPWGYYGMLGRQRLGEAPVPSHDVSYDFRQREGEPDAALVAAGLGLSDEARTMALVAPEARAADPHWRLAVEARGADWAVWEAEWRRGGAALPSDERSLGRWALAHPRFYADTVEDVARREGIAPELIWAVMQKESTYNPRAVSVSDAMGLMQVIPQTAEAVARRLDEHYRDGMLFEPYHSIRYGGWYLGALTRHFGGQTPLAVAAYNAGPIAVEAWLERNGDAPMDVFVEEIPPDQTRDYVRRVLATHARYALAAGDPDVMGTSDAGGLFPDRIRRDVRDVVDF
jgi:soluble lytic murein transglycosylase